MPNNVTQIPAARVLMNDPNNGYVNRPWYRYFYNLFVILGSGSLRYGTFYDTTTQHLGTALVAQAVTYDTPVLSAGVTIGTPSSRLYVDRNGAYNFQFSLQMVSRNPATKFVYIWARINGVDVPYSATKITMQGNNDAYVAAWNFVLRMSAGDYFELMWTATNANIEIQADGGSAPVPQIPSVIMTVTCNIGD